MNNLPKLPTTFWGRLALLTLFWVGFTLVIVGHAYVTLVYVVGTEYRIAYGVSGTVQGLVWIGVTPLVVALVRRFPLAGRQWARNSLLHAGIAAVLTAVVAVLVVLLTRPLAGAEAPSVAFGSEFLSAYIRVVLLFEILWFGVAAAATAWGAMRMALSEQKRAAANEAELREREVRDARLRERAAQLEGQLAAAQLEALRMQLNPHFLFNTLHAVSTLMARDVDGARRMISDLSDLLRRVLDDADAQEVPLDDELDVLGHYLDIERTRFADRLAVDLAVDDGARGALVPTLILQPLVENAIQHGIAPRGEGGRIEIEAVRQNGSLVVRIGDDGPGLPAKGLSREGVGLKNTRDRLAKLYGEGGALTLRNRPEGGLDAEVRLPYRAA